MNSEEYSELVSENTPQVFICTCPVTVPYSIASHSWFVTSKNSSLNRWELLSFKNDTKPEWGHIHKNQLSPFQGVRIFPIRSGPYWPTRIRDSITGQPAENVIEAIESTPQTYPYKDEYKLLGPNSNTYTQWVLNECPASNADLPWNAVGKGFL